MAGQQVCCWHSLHYGNLALALFQATCYLASIIWLFVIYDKFLEVDSSRYTIIFLIGLLSLLVFNCLLLKIGIVMKLYCLLLPWIIGQELVIAGSIIVPIVLMFMGKITDIMITLLIMLIFNVYQIYHLKCVKAIYLRIKGSPDNPPESRAERSSLIVPTDVWNGWEY